MSDAPPIGSGWLEGQRRAVTVLVVLALLSLVLVVMARGGASVITYTMLGGLHPPLVLDAGELLLTGLLALVLSPSLKPAVPRAWGRTAIGATVWLGFEAAVVGLTHLWVPTASGFEAILLFVVLGVVAEEWLFRGAVYGAAVAALGERPVGRLQLP